MDLLQIFFRFTSRKLDFCFYYKREVGIYVVCGCLVMDMTLCVDLDMNFSIAPAKHVTGLVCEIQGRVSSCNFVGQEFGG